VQVIGHYVNMIPVFLGGMIPVWFLTGEYSRMSIVGIFSGAFLFGLVLIGIGSWYIKENEEFYKHMQATQSIKELFRLSRDLLKDRVFLIFMAAFIFIQAGTGKCSFFRSLLDGSENLVPEIRCGRGC
jgi:hypothetical protein